MPDVAAVVESAVAAVPAATPVEASAPDPPPAAPPAPVAPVGEPADHPESVPQYHAPNKSEYEVIEAPAQAPSAAPAAAPEPAPEPPAESPRPQPAADDSRAQGMELPDIPQQAVPELTDLVQLVDIPEPAVPELRDPVPLADIPEPSVAPADGAGNVNVSIRIFSPGDDGPVTQIVQGGSTGRASPVSAPTTWTWNWNWVGAPGCDPGQPGSMAPPLGGAGWTWNWTWSCGSAGAPVIDFPGMDDLPNFESLPGFESLPDLDSLPGIESLPAITGLSELALLNSRAARPDETAADAPAIRAGRERSGGTNRSLQYGGPAARARASQPGGLALFAGSTDAPRPVADRDAKRRDRRDTTGVDRVIPAQNGPVAPSVAVASAAAAAGAGAAPAMLTTLTFLFLCFLAGALIACVGLPRPKLRASRLERPG